MHDVKAKYFFLSHALGMAALLQRIVIWLSSHAKWFLKKNQTISKVKV